jgi:putative redox protein
MRQPSPRRPPKPRLPPRYDEAVKHRSAHLVYDGASRFDARTGTGRTIVFGDVATANELSPVETLVAALAACSAMDVIGILVKKRQVIDRYEIEVQADQRDQFPQVLTRIDVTHVVDGTVVLEQAVRRAVELSATRYCPVSAMLSSGATEIHHGFRMRCTGLELEEAEGEVIVTGPFRPPTIVPD